MSRFKKLLLSSACVLAVSASPLQAAEISAKGAEDLKSAFQDLISYQQNLMRLQGSELNTDGTISVTPENGYYAVKLPDISITDFIGRKTKVGVIAVNAIPGEKEGRWKVAVALPTPITYFDSDNTPTGQLDIGRQKMAGLWLEDIGTFVQLDAAYDDIRFRDVKAKIDMTAPHMEAKYGLKEDANGLWSGPMNGFIENMTVTNPVEKFKVTMGKIGMEMTMDGYNPKAVKSFKDQMGAVAEVTNNLQSDMSAQHAMGFYNMITEFLGKAWNGFTSQITVKDLTVDVPATPGQPATTVHVGDFGYGLDLTGFNTQDVSLRFRFGFNDMDMSPFPKDAEAMKNIIPSGVNMDVKLDKLPFQKLVELGGNTLKQTTENPQMAQMGGMTFLMTLPQLLTQAGSTVSVDNNYVKATDYKATLDGKFTANMNVPQGAVGEATMHLNGLDKLLATLQQEAQGGDQGAQQAIQGLSMLQMFGQMEEGQTDTRKYHFEITPQGQMMLNGTDMNAMMGMGGGAPR